MTGSTVLSTQCLIVNEISNNAYLVLLVTTTLAATSAFAQGKGVDTQNQRITERGGATARRQTTAPSKTLAPPDQGINFGKEKTTAENRPARIHTA